MNKVSNIDIDANIIEENNQDINKLKQELLELEELLQSLNKVVYSDKEKLDNIDNITTESNIDISLTLDNLNDVVVQINKIDKLKVIGGALLGTTFGSLAFIGGIIPGVITMGIGLGTGAGLGYLSRFI